MSRKRKRPELRPIDEAAEQEEAKHYFRIAPEDGHAEEQVVVKLEPEQPEIRKLDIPLKGEVDMRANEPTVDNLITVTRPTLEEMEADWGASSKASKPIPWGWFVLLGLVLAGASVWSFAHIRGASDQLENIRLETENIIDSEQASIAQASEQISRIEQSLIEFSEAETVEAMASVVRQPERVKPLMLDHYARHPLQPLGRPRVDALRPLTLGNQGQFWMATLAFSHHDRRNVIVEMSEDGEARVDWETKVCHQPIPWDEYARTRPVGSTLDFRVYVEPDSLYSHEFRDTLAWDCYKLTALDSEEFLFGYVRADNPAAALLRQWFLLHPSRPASMILRLSLPEGITAPRGVIIDDVLSVRWIYIVPPSDNS